MLMKNWNRRFQLSVIFKIGSVNFSSLFSRDWRDWSCLGAAACLEWFRRFEWPGSAGRRDMRVANVFGSSRLEMLIFIDRMI